MHDPGHTFSALAWHPCPAAKFRKGRTQRSIEYYDEILFHHANFADMLRPDGPMIVINAPDLAKGFRFSFIQGYFDLLCSDLSTYPVANAVAASSTVPVMFNPVVIENFTGCKSIHKKPPRQIVFRAVNASTSQEPDMDMITRQPGMIESMNAMTDAQLCRC